MMRQIVVTIMGRADNARLAAYLDSDSTHPKAKDYCPIALDLNGMPPLDTSENVTAYGTAVCDALSYHPAIQHELNGIFGLALPDRSTVKFLIKTPDAELFRWETLYSDEPKRFLAMSDVHSISRVTPARVGPSVRGFNYPLRMAAFLSAAGIEAKTEFEKICGQVKQANLNLECTAYLGEQQLLDDVRRRIANGDLKDKGIVAEPIPPSGIEIGKLLRNAPVQFLHFFCHGIVGAGVEGLSLATINDHDKNNFSGNAAAASIFLTSDALSEALAINKSIWITVLNCCSGAQVIRQLHSIALNVAMKGCPYTVGMAEPIEVTEATAFSEAFYGELFAIVTKGLAQGADAGSIKLDLSPAVIPARKIIHELCRDKPNAFGRWLLPLLYERSLQPLVVQAIDPAMADRIQEVARTLRAMPSDDTPVTIEVRDKILQILDEEPVVPMNLRPSRYGTFA
jgi:hypothetical protein